MFLLRNEKTSYPDIAVISGMELLLESQNRILMVNFCLDFTTVINPIACILAETS